MEKKAQLYEILIKFSFALFSFICAIFVVENILFLLPLFKTSSLEEFEILGLIYKTPFGSLLKDIGTFNNVNVEILFKGFISFLSNLSWASIIFLFMFLSLLILRFVFIKWSLISDYITLSIYEILFFILKYISFGVSMAILYKGGATSMAAGCIVGSILFIVFSLAQLFILSLWIIKFIFNIVGDLKYYFSH